MQRASTPDSQEPAVGSLCKGSFPGSTDGLRPGNPDGVVRRDAADDSRHGAAHHARRHVERRQLLARRTSTVTWKADQRLPLRAATRSWTSSCRCGGKFLELVAITDAPMIIKGIGARADISGRGLPAPRTRRRARPRGRAAQRARRNARRARRRLPRRAQLHDEEETTARRPGRDGCDGARPRAPLRDRRIGQEDLGADLRRHPRTASSSTTIRCEIVRCNAHAAQMMDMQPVGSHRHDLRRRLRAPLRRARRRLSHGREPRHGLLLRVAGRRRTAAIWSRSRRSTSWRRRAGASSLGAT